MPNVFFPKESNIDIHKTMVPSNENKGNLSLPMQSMSEPQTGGETHPLSELRVYARKRYHHSTVQPTVPLQDQSLPPRTGDLNTSGNLSIPTSSLPINEFSDLNVPIAIRKGVRTCTKHTIAKYLSYQRLSKKHRTFICNISQHVGPRNI